MAAVALLTFILLAVRRPSGPSAGRFLSHGTAMSGIGTRRGRRTDNRPSPLQPIRSLSRSMSPYGTEKRQWLEETTAEFHKSAAGHGIKVHLHGMGSLEAARAVIEGSRPVPIHVWSPASSAYRDTFEEQWRTKHLNRPIIK